MKAHINIINVRSRPAAITSSWPAVKIHSIHFGSHFKCCPIRQRRPLFHESNPSIHAYIHRSEQYQSRRLPIIKYRFRTTGLLRFSRFHVVRIDLELSCLRRPLVFSFHIPTRPYCSQKSIPDREEWLAKVCLDAPTLVVDVMISGVVACDML